MVNMVNLMSNIRYLLSVMVEPRESIRTYYAPLLCPIIIVLYSDLMTLKTMSAVHATSAESRETLFIKCWANPSARHSQASIHT